MSHLFKGNMNCGVINAPMVFLIASLLLLVPWSMQTANVLADEDTDVVESPLSLPSAAEADTVRTNVWLTEALMAEIVASSAHVLPAPPAAVQLIQKRDSVEDNLFKGAVVRVLGGLGYEVYLADEDPAHQAAVDCFYSFSVHGVELDYPEVGRTLGLWRRWIDRELRVTVQVDLTMANSGRMLLSDRIQRRFSDRVPDDDFSTVDSDLYEFTTAETSESGWKGRMEELIVLGTLVGLVAVYFANTGD
jgi:hypothetical protein